MKLEGTISSLVVLLKGEVAVRAVFWIIGLINSGMVYYKILFFVGLANGLYANTFMVSNVNDAGAGSFRQALLDANSNSGLDTIQVEACRYNDVAKPIAIRE